MVAINAPRERRQLTVLFCDLAGSTSLSARMDAEDLGEVIGQYFALCRATFEKHGGYVDREEGDCLRVYFGYPHSHEDDPVRCARAALEVASAVHRLGERLHPRIGSPLEVHIGIHTGEVVAGELEHTGGKGPLVVGVVPNVAKRLEEFATPRTVVLSGATHRLLSPAFICEPLGWVEFKGLPEPVEVLRLVQDRDLAGALELLGVRKLGPLLGREEEMALLERRWNEARAGRGQVVLVSGEPGIGKSRLVHDFVGRLAREPHRVEVMHCQEPFSNTALFPLIDLLRKRLQFQRDDTAQEKRLKLDAAFAAGLLPEPGSAERVAALLALPVADPDSLLPARRQREETLRWLLAWLTETSGQRPTLLVLEDIHWADATTLEFIASVAAKAALSPVMLILTYRPDFAPNWPIRSHASLLVLKRLAPVATRTLIRNIAGELVALPALLDRIAERSDGVPLYAEELTAMLVESGAIYEGAGKRDAEPAVSIPQTLRGSLVARLDHLKRAKPVAQLAAVLGREFSRRLVACLAGLDDISLQAALDELVGAELLYRTAPEPDARFAFKHVLVQEAAYLSLLRSQRLELHDRTARALVERFPDVAEANPEIVALHCAAAGRHSDAVDGWYRASVMALEASAEVEAVAHLKRALQQLPALPAGPERDAREVRCLITLGSALAELRGYAATEVEETFRRVHRLCEGLGDTDELYSALTGMHAFYQVRGQLRRAVEIGRNLVRLGDAHGGPLRRAQAHRCLGWSLFCCGELRSSKAHLDITLGLFNRGQAAEHSRIHGMHPWVAGLCNSGLLEWFVGHPDDAVERCGRGLALARELRHPVQLAYALSVSAAVHACRAEPAETLELVQELRRLAAGDTLPYWVAWGSTLGGWAEAMLGRDETGLAELRDALDRYRSTGAGLFEPWSLGLLAQVHAAAGRSEQALATLESALASPLLSDGYFLGSELYRIKGQLLYETTNDKAMALRCVRYALQTARAQGAKVLEQRAAELLAAYVAESR